MERKTKQTKRINEREEEETIVEGGGGRRGRIGARQGGG